MEKSSIKILIGLFIIGRIIILIFLNRTKTKIYLYQIFNVIINSTKLIFNYSWIYIFLCIIFSVFQGFFPIISLLIMQKMINAIQMKNIGQDIFLKLIFIYIVLEMIDLMAVEIYNLYSTTFMKRFTRHIEILMLEKANRLTTKDFENKEIYDLINRAQSQNGATVIDYFNSWILIFQQAITIFSSIIIIISYQYWIVILIIIAPVIQFYYSQKLGHEQYEISMKRTSEERKCWYINFLMLLGNSIKETILYGLGNLFINQYGKLKEKFILQDYKIMKKTFEMNFIIIIIGQLFTGVIYFHILLNGFWQKIYMGDVTTYITCITTIKNGIEVILSMMSTIYSKSLYMELLFRFFDIPEKTELNKTKLKIDNIEKIELKHLYYKFTEDSGYVLKDINLELKKNSPIALVGRNGSGKSTLIKIILGIYDDYEGDILINGINLHNIEKENYYNKISCVFQDYTKYEASVKENVGYGNLDQINNEDLIKESLIKSGLDINQLGSNKLNTILGYWFGENQLSEGQWQKIAISRAMMKDADFYILDEPDAALDGIAENDMLLTYKKMFENKFGIFVSHKTHHLNLLCENIIVLNNGQIAECGNHEELIEKEGIYHQLYSSQIISKLETN
ncbi:ABC transporter ATP-binding protein [Clostridioides difficile]|nr:ABC transporter ATP-binding protein [Clostridioides difficile]